MEKFDHNNILAFVVQLATTFILITFSLNRRAKALQAIKTSKMMTLPRFDEAVGKMDN